MQNLDVNISIDSAKVIEDKVSAILSHQRVDNPIETFDQNINQLINGFWKVFYEMKSIEMTR